MLIACSQGHFIVNLYKINKNKKVYGVPLTFSPAAFDTIRAHLCETGRRPADYDRIFTGDLGSIGGEILTDLMAKQGYDIRSVYHDCGCMIYDPKRQDVHAGGSGCGCVASVLCGYILPQMRKRKWKRVLVVGTGALLSTTSGLQGESVPGIAHAIAIEAKE